jgi:chromosome segregation ATPase
MFRRFLKSGKITDFNKALQEERDALEKAEETAKIQDDIRRRKPTNDLVQLAENIEEQLKVIKDVLLGTKTTPGVLEEKRAELQEAQKLVQAEIERLAASIQADKKKIESDKVKLATAKRGTSLSRNLARET